MEANKFGYWLQVGANIGILGGLILVGFQIQQNSDLMRTQLLYEESDRASQVGLAVLGEDPTSAWVKSIVSPEEMTFREQRIVETMIWLEIETWRGAYKLQQLGLIKDDWKLRVDQEAAFTLNYPFGRSVWKHNKDGVPPELAQYVNQTLAGDSFNPANYYADIMADTRTDRTPQE